MYMETKLSQELMDLEGHLVYVKNVLSSLWYKDWSGKSSSQ